MRAYFVSAEQPHRRLKTMNLEHELQKKTFATLKVVLFT